MRFVGAGEEVEVFVGAFAPASQGSVRGMGVVFCREELRSGVSNS